MYEGIRNTLDNNFSRFCPDNEKYTYVCKCIHFYVHWGHAVAVDTKFAPLIRRIPCVKLLPLSILCWIVTLIRSKHESKARKNLSGLSTSAAMFHSEREKLRTNVMISEILKFIKVWRTKKDLLGRPFLSLVSMENGRRWYS